MLHWRLTRGPKEPCIRWGQDRTSPFAAARGDKSAVRPFAKLLCILVHVNTDWPIFPRFSYSVCTFGVLPVEHASSCSADSVKMHFL